MLIIRSPRVSPAFKCECKLRLRLVVIFSVVREEFKGGVNWLIVRYIIDSIIEHESLKAELIPCPAGAYFFNVKRPM